MTEQEEPDIPIWIKDEGWYLDTKVALNALRGYLTTVGREDDAYYVEQTQGVMGGLRDAVEDEEDAQKEDSNEG